MVSSTIIDNKYDMILLFSDGVTDIITDAKIKELINEAMNKINCFVLFLCEKINLYFALSAYARNVFYSFHRKTNNC